MSCDACELAQYTDYHVFPYEWGSTTIEIGACKKHAEEIKNALNSVLGEKE